MTQQTESTPTTYARPGLVTFAAVMIILLGGIYLVTAIEEFSNAVWLNDVSFGLFGQSFALWGVIDLIIGVALIVAGVSIWRGGNFGWWVGMIGSIIGAVRWFFFIPWAPIGSLIVITIAIVIMYGLSSHREYFDR